MNDRSSPGLSDSSDDQAEEYSRIPNIIDDFTYSLHPGGPSTTTFISNPTKRRFPGSLIFPGGAPRDPKSRRKGPGGGSGSLWEAGMSMGPPSRGRDDLVDSHIVEQLRAREFFVSLVSVNSGEDRGCQDSGSSKCT